MNKGLENSLNNDINEKVKKYSYSIFKITAVFLFVMILYFVLKNTIHIYKENELLKSEVVLDINSPTYSEDLMYNLNNRKPVNLNIWEEQFINKDSEIHKMFKEFEEDKKASIVDIVNVDKVLNSNLSSEEKEMFIMTYVNVLGNMYNIRDYYVKNYISDILLRFFEISSDENKLAKESKEPEELIMLTLLSGQVMSKITDYEGIGDEINDVLNKVNSLSKTKYEFSK